MNNYEYTPLYYATPCQVRFFNYNTQNMEGGIALYDLILGGKTGHVFFIPAIIEEAAKYNIHWDDAVVELDWVNLEKFIREG